MFFRAMYSQVQAASHPPQLHACHGCGLMSYESCNLIARLLTVCVADSTVCEARRCTPGRSILAVHSG